MKKTKLITLFILFLSTFTGLISNTANVNAQEGAGELVQVDVNVFIQLMEGEAIPQNQISFDIIEPNPAGGDGTVIWQYRSDNPPQEALYLAPGQYRFRLFDGGGFEREGLPLLPGSVEQTNPNLSQEDINMGQDYQSLADVGQLNEWSDGTVVYDLPFTVEVGDNTFNPALNQHEMALNITLSTAGSHNTTEQDSDSELDEEIDSLATVQAGMVAAEVQVSDEVGNPVPGTTVYVAGQSVTTDENGQAFISDLTPGTTVTFTFEAPEGYSGSGESDAIELQPDTIYEINTTLTRDAETSNDLIFTVVGENGQPMSGVIIDVNGMQLATNELGQAEFTGLSDSEVAYSLYNLPENYSLSESQSNIINLNETGPTQETIELETDIVLGGIEFFVIDEEQNPVSNVEINIAEQIITTDEFGRGQVQDLEMGGFSYTVTSVPEGYSLPEAGTVNVDPAENYTVEILLEWDAQSANAVINVSDEEGIPVAGAEILIDNQTVTTNTEGNAVIENLTIGETYSYTLLNVPDGYNLPENNEEMYLTLDTSENGYVSIQVPKQNQTGSIQFMIRNEQGEGIPNVSIEVAGQVVVTDETGQAAASDIAVGTYSYQIINAPENYNGNYSGEVTVTAGETAEETEALEVEETFGNVSFAVRDQEGNPVPAAQIYINDSTFTTNEQGDVLVDNLIAGEIYNYTVTSLPENYSGLIEGNITIQTDDTIVETITVEQTQPQGELRIRALNEDDMPVEGVIVQLSNDMTAATSVEGEAVFSDLEAGSYQYSVIEVPDNYQLDPTVQAIEVNDEEPIAATIHLEAESKPSTVNILVRDQEEQPIDGAVLNINESVYTSDSEGRITIESMDPGEYNYSVIEVPEGYLNEGTAGQITVKEDEESNQEILINRMIELSDARYTVIDQNNDPVSDVAISFGGLSGVTNQNGQVEFVELEPGNYTLSMTNVPEGYRSTIEDSLVMVEEGQTIEEELTIEKQRQEGTVTIKVMDNQNRPIPGAEIELGGQTGTTNSEGNVVFNRLEIREYTYQVVSIPEGYELSRRDGNITVNESETNHVEIELASLEASSEESSSEDSASESLLESEANLTVTDETSITPAEQENIEAEAAKATRQFTDPETGIEVWVNPADAADIERIEVNILEEVSALQGTDSDSYEIKLLDQNNEIVPLTRIAEVKLPTKPVTSQLRIVRVADDNLSNLTFALHNQRVTFRTQQLGTFGIVYRTTQPVLEEDSSVNVSMESSVEEKQNALPGTGEGSIWMIVLLAVVLLLGGVFVLFYRRKGN